MNENIHLHRFENSDFLVASLCQEIAHKLQEAISQNNKASLMVSGGSTPKKLFEHLKMMHLPWEKVSIGLCDERWVNEEHKDSNARFVNETLMQAFAVKAHFIPMYLEAIDVFKAEAMCEENLKMAFESFDVLILGMGTDGHTASLFPKNEKLQEAFTSKNMCIAIQPPPYASHDRMSLTLDAILKAKNIYLHFEGEEKMKVFELAITTNDPFAMPIAALTQQKTKTIEVYYA